MRRIDFEHLQEARLHKDTQSSCCSGVDSFELAAELAAEVAGNKFTLTQGIE